MKEKFQVTGMSCSACQATVEKAVSKVNGINSVAVNLLTNSMQVEYDEKLANSENIEEAVKKAGYQAVSLVDNISKSNQKRKKVYPDGNIDLVTNEEQNLKRRWVLSLCFLVPLMYIAMHHMIHQVAPVLVPEFITSLIHGNENAVIFSMLQFLLLLPIMDLNRKYFTAGFKSLFRRSPNMDSLIAVGSTAAFLYGIFAIFMIGYGLGHQNADLVSYYNENIYFESAGTILTFVTIGKYLEAKSKGKTTGAISALMNLAPEMALVERSDVAIPVDEVIVGDIFLVKPGMKVPVDGVVISGNTGIDESAITGESIPVEKNPGDKVIAATTNKNGFIRCKAEKVGKDTTIAQIIKLVEEASSSKAPIARLADKIAGIFVPVVMIIALITLVIWLFLGAGFEFAMSCAITVLVISCPCALGLATPVAIMVGTGVGAKQGILIKSGDALQLTKEINIVVFDKTGTLTEGRPKVTDCVTYGVTKNEFLEIAAGLERLSSHPLAQAVMEEALTQKVQECEVRDFFTEPGKGIGGKINSRWYYAGNEQMMTAYMVNTSGQWQEEVATFSAEGKTPMVIAGEQGIIGVMAVADRIKSTSREAVEKLHKMGIDVVMLTGDNTLTAQAIGGRLNIKNIIANVLPQEKEKVIRNLQSSGRKVAMVGDGINDAPALITADVGIAIGTGTDVAIESADIILMHNEPLDVVTAISLSKSVIRNIKQNLFWAFFYNSIGIPLAAGVFYGVWQLRLSPMFGAAAMGLSSVFVVGNALRLRKPGRKIKREDKKMFGYQVKIEGMMCEHCAGRVEKALKAVEGVTEVSVNLQEKVAHVTANRKLEKNEVHTVIQEAGYEMTDLI